MKFLIRRNVQYEFALVEASSESDVFAAVRSLPQSSWTPGFNDYMIEAVEEEGCGTAACDISRKDEDCGCGSVEEFAEAERGE